MLCAYSKTLGLAHGGLGVMASNVVPLDAVVVDVVEDSEALAVTLGLGTLVTASGPGVAALGNALSRASGGPPQSVSANLNIRSSI